MIARGRPGVIFFDIDETLMDQRAAEMEAGEAFLRRFGGELEHIADVPTLCAVWRALREKHAAEFFARRITFSEARRRRVRELFAPTGRSLSDAECDARLAVYVEHYRRAWRLFADVRPCLEALSGEVLGVISNGSTAQQHEKLRATGIHVYFSVVMISESARWAKPEAGIFTAACRAAGAEPARCLHIGDRLEADAVAGCAAGLRGVWLNRRGASATAPAPVESIASLRDLPALLGGGELQRAIAASPEAAP